MAYGAPDWWSRSHIDIIAQTLAEITQRPKYGGALLSSWDGSVNNNAKTELISVTGKGMIYAGNLWLNPLQTQANSYVELEVDGTSIAYTQFVAMNTYSWTTPQGHPFFLTKFDDTTFYYSVLFMYGITFESGFRILYDEKHGRNPTVGAKMRYAVI